MNLCNINYGPPKNKIKPVLKSKIKNKNLQQITAYKSHHHGRNKNPKY